jgi:hypothetical protein
MQRLRWPRLAAGLIDFAPLAVALWLVAPLLVTLGFSAYESHAGMGIFDPTTGEDPILTAHLNGQRTLAIGALIGGLGWIAAEALMLARGRASAGQSICGLVVQRCDGQPATLGRRLLRGSVRQALAVAQLATAVLAAHPDAPGLPRRYWQYLPKERPPLIPTFTPQTLAPVAVGLAGALALVIAVDVVLLLSGARSLGDRLAGTALRRR